MLIFLYHPHMLPCTLLMINYWEEIPLLRTMKKRCNPEYRVVLKQLTDVILILMFPNTRQELLADSFIRYDREV